MKKKLIVTMLTLMLGLTLFAGGTMAWFTHQASAGETTFTAGTLKFDIKEGGTEQSPIQLTNINPGDVHTVQWIIKNTGTKKQQFRVFLKNVQWESSSKFDPILSTDNVSFELAGGDWRKETVKGGAYYYYTGNSGVFEPNAEIVLELKVLFDGKKTTNSYQGKKFSFGLDLQAIQTTNGATWKDFDDQSRGRNDLSEELEEVDFIEEVQSGDLEATEAEGAEE